ncbi:MAG: NAD(P)/FAD-dependent oxidoreductase [Anaerolineales bacterium]|nr:NAD(P)/FAD-dependent oxidoreductase [Anaerolineales bacterium]
MPATETPAVVIVGAGPAGSALAYFLASAGLAVRLLDKAEFPRDKTCGDGLSPRALHVLRRIGALEAVLAAGFRVNRLKVYAPDGAFFDCPIPAHAGLADFAMVLPRYQLDDLIRQRAVAAGAVFQQATVSEVLRDAAGRGVGVRLTDGTEVRARAVVLATGAATAVLERAGLAPAAPTLGRAARTYFTAMHGLEDAVEFHFDSVPLPGYGWVFPTSPTTANVGAGYFVRAGGRAPHASPRQTFDEFVENPYVAGLLAGAQPAAPVKGFPLRLDFPTARLAAPGIFMVGEAAGLVNPLTGEGVDYALESAEVAAATLLEVLRASPPPERAVETYTRALRARFQRGFVNIGRVRDLYFQPWVLNRFVRAANRYAALKLQIVNIALGNVDALTALRPGTLWRVVFG